VSTRVSAISILIALLACPAGWAEDDPSLVAQYTFEEGPGETIKDWSGNGNDGKNLGAEYVDLGDDKGFALRFAQANAHVDCGDPPGLDLTDALTIEFWLYRETTIRKGEVGLVGKTIDTFTMSYGGRCWLYVNGGPNHSYLEVPLKEWRHVAATFDGKKLVTYLDGKLQHAFDSKFTTIKHGDNFYLRYPVVYGDKVEPSFKCMMDNVRIYNRALPAEEIAAQYRREAKDKEEDVDRLEKVKLTSFLFPGSGALVVEANASNMELLPGGSQVSLELREGVSDRGVSRHETDALPASGKIYWTVDIADFAPGDYRLLARVTDNGAMIGVSSSARVTIAGERPAWSKAYDDAKVLNNFVAELLDVREPAKEADKSYPFMNPRDGWVFISSTASPADGEKVFVSVDSDNADDAMIVHVNAGEPSREAMRYLQAGPHMLYVRSEGNARVTQLTLRAIPEIIRAGLGYDPCPWLEQYGPYDWEYLEKIGALANANVILERRSRPENARHLSDWRKAGKRVLSYYNLTPLLRKGDQCTADEIVETWTSERGMSQPGYRGIMLDEFTALTATQYAAFTEAIRRMAHDPELKDRACYPYCTPMYLDTIRTAFLETVLDEGYNWAAEMYLNEQPAESAARDFMNENLKGKMLRYQKALPDCARRMIVNLGNFSTPAESSDIDTEADYKVYLDMQMNMLANDPVFFGLYGFAWYHTAYADEEIMRWCAKLLRHYGIEGKRERLSNDPYMLPHLANGDFTRGGAGWMMEPAEPGSIAVRRAPGYGWLQGRWQKEGPGDVVLVTRRSAKAPNVVQQPVRNLTPGRLYSLRYFVTDFADFSCGISDDKPLHFTTDIEGATLIPDKTFSERISSRGHAHGPFDRNNPLFMTYHRAVFRAEKEDAALILSDWDGENDPGGPEGQKLGFNYIQIQPYLED